MDDAQTSSEGDFCPGISSVKKRRTGSEELSCVSMRSDQSMNPPLFFNDGSTLPGCKSIISANTCSVKPIRTESADPSCVSMKSDQSINPPLHFNDGNTSSSSRKIKYDMKVNIPKPSHVPVKRDCSVDQPILSSGGNTACRVVVGHPHRRTDPSTVFNHEVLSTFKSNLKRKFQCLYEGTAMQGNPTLLNEIYTELYITESESGEISNEHEVRQIETQSRRATAEDTPIKCRDIFRALPGQDKPIRTVLTKGVAGIGKTVSVQKFILDWAEGKENQDVQLIFPLPFRELNLMKDKTLSLSDLLHDFFPETKEVEISSKIYKVLFIFDGLDECRLSLDFQSDVRLCDVSESVSVDVLLMNLIVGNLLPSALIWITSRPAAADLVPSECVHRVTEVRGFNDPQKEEYFRKRVSDQSLAERIISHLKSSRSLFIMCHIPVFCWISAAVLEKMLSRAERGEIPKTLTQMYTHFLTAQINIKDTKYNENKDTDKEMVLKLGKLAFEQLDRGNLIFYEEDLRECGIDVTEASVYSGLCTQIFREESGLYQGKIFCFVHLSVQEHLAALHVHLSCTNQNINAFDQILVKKNLQVSDLYKRTVDDEYNSKFYKNSMSIYSFSELHQRAVNEALHRKNRHLDLFVRFLLGLSVESNQSLLKDLKIQKETYCHNKEETVTFINNIIRKSKSPEKSINLFHCLNELGDHSLMEEIQHYLKSGKVKEIELSVSQRSALVFVLLNSEQDMDMFCLSKYTGSHMTPDEVLETLLPVIKASKSAQLDDRNLTEISFTHLASVLSSNCSCLRDLDLSGNYLGNYGVELFCAGLKNPHCKLEKLELMCCGVTDKGCAVLASALRSNPSHLRELNLEWNKLGKGVKLLTDLQRNPYCKLETLRFNDMYVTAEGCAALASALRSNPSHLNLCECNLGELGMKLLSTVLENPQCKVKTLELRNCGITAESCTVLASALRSNPSHLRELDLTWNHLGDTGVTLLSAGLEHSHCKLQILKLEHCAVAAEGCDALASALRSNPSHLKQLDLTWNHLGDTGVTLLSAGLENPHCKLEMLRLRYCGVTDEGCAALASALRSNPEHLRELDLTGNKLGVHLISHLKNDPLYKIGL